jgi:hypothetical protein
MDIGSVSCCLRNLVGHTHFITNTKNTGK